MTDLISVGQQWHAD